MNVEGQFVVQVGNIKKQVYRPARTTYWDKQNVALPGGPQHEAHRRPIWATRAVSG